MPVAFGIGEDAVAIENERVHAALPALWKPRICAFASSLHASRTYLKSDGGS